MLDAIPSRLTMIGTVTVTDGDTVVSGFAADNASCRDVAALSLTWAIGKLQQDLLKTLERPGGGHVVVD